jgi:predicted metal-dependent peptidase
MTPEAKVMNSRMKLRRDVPYIGDVLLYLQPEYDDAVGTMGVDMDGKLTVSPTWTDTLKPEQVTAVIIHEVLHILLMHCFRDPPEVMNAKRGEAEMTRELAWKHSIANVACDLKVNFIIIEMGKSADLPPTECLPDRYGNWSFEVKPGKKHHIRNIQGKSVEELYREIIDAYDREGNPQYKGTVPGLGNFVTLDNHDQWASSSGSGNNQSKSKAEIKQKASDWMVRAAGVVNAHKAKGTMPSQLLREIELMLTPVIDWKGKLHQYVQPIVAQEMSYRRIRKSSWAHNIILPGRSGEGVHIIAHVDTSGSMHKKELEQITAELYGILDAYPYVRITLLHSDACEPQVTELRETDRDDILNIVKLDGGGGTSHRPVVKWVLENKVDDTHALICFTDGYSDIQSCFDDLIGVVSRMLILTREDQIKKLKDYCDDYAYLPVA